MTQPPYRDDETKAMVAEVSILWDLYQLDLDRFKVRLARLYDAGVPYVDLWQMVYQMDVSTDFSYSTVRNWVNEGKNDLSFLTDTLSEPYTPATWYGHHAAPARVYVQIPESEHEMFTRLAYKVSGLRGTTAQDSPLWKARDMYEDAIWTYYQRGVRISDIARVAGVTHRAIRHRINRQRKLRDKAAIPTP